MAVLFLLLLFLITTATSPTPTNISSHPHHRRHPHSPPPPPSPLSQPPINLSQDPLPSPPLPSLHSPPPPPSLISPPPPAPPPLRDLHQDPLTALISALSSSSNFQAWASLLLSTAPIPGVTATLFVPSDASLSHLPTQFDHLLIPYHIVPNSLLNFSSLLDLSPLSRLPTLLPYHYLLLTNTSADNFTVDDSLITLPDLFLSPNFAVHGIRNVLDYNLYLDIPDRNVTGGSGSLSPPSPLPEVVISLDSGADVADEFGIVFLLVFFSGLALTR